MLRSRRGITLIELLIVVTMMGLMAALFIPRLRPSAATKTRMAADQIVRDLELARNRALSTRSAVRIVFDAAGNSYTGYRDFDRNNVFALSTNERDSLGGFTTRPLQDGSVFGRGAAPDLPTIPGGGAITFAGSAITFDARGLTTPFGTRGVIYVTHPTDATAIAAVGITPGGSIRRWVYRGGTWQ